MKGANSKQCRKIITVNDTDGTMVNPKQCFKLYTI